MKFDLKNRLDLAIAVSAAVLVVTGAFLRFFKYFFEPLTLERLTYILVPETAVLTILLTIKIWRK